MAQTVKNLPAMQETQVQSLCWEDPLEKGMATHSSTNISYSCDVLWQNICFIKIQTFFYKQIEA